MATVNLNPFIANPSAPDTGVTISVKNQETVTWEADQDFRIISARPRPDNAAKPDNPFYRPLPFAAMKGGGNKFRANSGPAVPGAATPSGQEYKIRFKVTGVAGVIDPHIIIVK